MFEKSKSCNDEKINLNHFVIDIKNLEKKKQLQIWITYNGA